MRRRCSSSSTRTSSGRTWTQPRRTRSPRVCYGREELEIALARQAEHGLRAELEETIENGDRVMVVVRIPGVDAHRVKEADDRSFNVMTVRHGLIVALRDCRDRQEALAIAGIE